MDNKNEPKRHYEPNSIKKAKKDRYSRITLSFKPSDEERLLYVYLEEKARFGTIASVIKSLIYEQMIRENWHQNDPKYYQTKLEEYFPHVYSEEQKKKDKKEEEI